MSPRVRILLFIVAALGLPLFAVLWLAPPRSPARVQDPAYHFVTARVTHGTNHVLVLDRSLSARLNAGMRRALSSQDQTFTKATPREADLLWVAYFHDGELVRISPSGTPGPDLNSFEVLAPGPEGENMVLRPVGGSYNPASGLYVTILALPAGVSNLLQCELRFPNGRRLGTLQVW